MTENTSAAFLLRLCILATGASSLIAQDPELTNYKSGIDVTWEGTKGVDYCEEYFYHDKLVDDHKVVYLRSTTPIAMAHNATNTALYGTANGGRQIIGVNGKDGQPDSGDEGVIRYKIDRDRQYYYKWADSFARKETEKLLPAYRKPFTLAELTYDGKTPVVGTTGDNGGPITSHSAYYYRGLLDSFGDEWHVLSYGDDSSDFLRLAPAFVDQAFYADDGKTVLLVVDPKTPCFTARAEGKGQFYTTPPKAYWTPKICEQTTYFSGTVTFELRDLYGHNVHYRINDGPWIDSKAAAVTLRGTDFVTGNNRLEYYYDGNAAHTKVRKLVKDPEFPSAKEAHGNFLWINKAGFNVVASRLSRPPYYATYHAYKTRADTSGQEGWDQYAGRGARYNGAGPGVLQGTSYALKNAFVAKVEGWNYTRSGARKTAAQYAKEMLLDSPQTIDPVGFEMQQSSDALPSREINYRGYYDALPVLQNIFAYDLLIANYKSTQFAGGITPIEDYFIRDRFAAFVFQAMQWSGDFLGGGNYAPGMWGGARMLCAASIAMIMPEYSTPFYGTSGFGSVQTTYRLCPYENDELTWKAALFDDTATSTRYPNFKWFNGLSTNGADSLFFSHGEVVNGVSFVEGQWRDKTAYFSSGLMGMHLMVWSNMACLWGGGHRNARLEKAILFATAGTLLGGKVDSSTSTVLQTPFRSAMLLNMNSRWPSAVANALTWVGDLVSTDSNSANKAMQDAGVFGFAWYDDQASTLSSPPARPGNLRLQAK